MREIKELAHKIQKELNIPWENEEFLHYFSENFKIPGKEIYFRFWHLLPKNNMVLSAFVEDKKTRKTEYIDASNFWGLTEEEIKESLGKINKYFLEVLENIACSR